ncbi:class I SAM-dependent methyltransferase [Bradyrhizobium japonicum]|uniref:class I SAM-dependent methyltransferase n=1 Tax=Bradyrhizobium japonicum TaxID=375 RepID=UPI002798B387|nr:class I SAM-dependent methyltransferase [Bradyrhizobium japonicum]
MRAATNPLSLFRSVDELLALPYFDLLACLTDDSLHPGGGAATQILLDACQIRHSERVLEIGCGPGWTTRALRRVGLNVTVVERSRLMVDAMLYHCRRENVPAPAVYIGPIEEFRPSAQSGTHFDVILLECVVGFVDNMRDMERAIRACLSSDGRVGVLDVHYKSIPPRSQLDALSALLGHRLSPMTRNDWLTCFSKLECRSFESFHLNPSTKSGMSELLRRPEVAAWLSSVSSQDVNRLALHLEKLRGSFEENKRHMEGHIAIFSKQ